MRNIRLHHDPIDDHIDAVFSFAVENGRGIEFVYHAVDPGADKTLTQQTFQQLLVLTLAVLNDRREQQNPGTFVERHDPVDHFTHGTRGQGDAVIRAAGFADPCVQKAQVVIDLGHGADRRPGVMGCRLLFDADGWRQAFDKIHIRFFHQREELPGVGRK